MIMSDFDWMQTPQFRRRPKATQETRDSEIQRRAAIMANMGFPRAKAEKRLKAYAKWEYERVGKPSIMKRIPGIVTQAYQRAGQGKSSKKKKS